MSTYHTPVLLQEVLEALDVQSGKRYIDATVGGGGHGIEIVKRGGMLLGIDTDREAVTQATKELRTKNPELKEGKSWIVVQGNFKDIEKIAKENGFDTADGILFDLGISSHQLDTGERGFSYRFTNAPLDLRLDQSSGESAAQLVNRLSEDELYELLARYAEEERARTIARTICQTRRHKKIETVGDIVLSVKRVVRDERSLPATLSRVFQAIRIAVNGELDSLQKGLAGADRILQRDGKLVVISFHSLEDRIVKQFMNRSGWQTITKKPIVAQIEETQRNPRSRSAKLRIAKKI